MLLTQGLLNGPVFENICHVTIATIMNYGFLLRRRDQNALAVGSAMVVGNLELTAIAERASSGEFAEECWV